MPVNGREVFAQMSKLEPDIPVIFMTGYATEANLIGAGSQVQPAALQKPRGTFVLAQKRREVLDKKNESSLRDYD